MEIINLKEKRNDLFSRNETEFEIENLVVPSAIEIKNLIKKKFSCEEDLIRIRKISSSFGKRIFKITADVYDSKEEFNRIVKKTKKEIAKEKKQAELKAEEEKKAKEEAKVVAEVAKVEAPVEEVPAEEVKEEKKE